MDPLKLQFTEAPSHSTPCPSTTSWILFCTIGINTGSWSNPHWPQACTGNWGRQIWGRYWPELSGYVGGKRRCGSLSLRQEYRVHSSEHALCLGPPSCTNKGVSIVKIGVVKLEASWKIPLKHSGLWEAGKTGGLCTTGRELIILSEKSARTAS